MQQPINAPQFPSLSLRDMTELLIKHYDVHSGLYDVGLQFKVSVGAMTNNQNGEILPGGMFGVASFTLVPAPKAGPHTVDAAVVNPAAEVAAHPASK